MSKNGLVVDGEGWFILNARESRWRNEGPLGSYCTFEGKRRFPQLGINISVLEPGEAMGMYHREKAQEAETKSVVPESTRQSTSLASPQAVTLPLQASGTCDILHLTLGRST
jgi:hypothetical protein